MDGKRLRELRKNKGIGQVELAERVGVTQGMISQLEVGSRNCAPDTLEAIARELNINVEQLSGEPAVIVRLVRNLKGLLPSQLLLINEVVLQFKRSPAVHHSGSSGIAQQRKVRNCCP
jgi:transcriptional regulator with XRE-family HTH domain